MELCENGDLHELITETRLRNDRLTDSAVMDYFVQICLALEYIHQQKILHRDLKTKNIFLKKGNIVKLGDFGVAKVLENSFELSCTCIGSPFYISPEMCENKPYDKKSDIWALGCVVFELATLKYAFTAKNMKSLMSRIIKADHNLIPDGTNPKIRHLIKKLLNANPRQRPVVTEILDMPFVAEFKKKVPCRRNCLVRSKSREDLQNNLKFGRALAVSKSSVNLNCRSITEPCVKYNSKLPIVNRLWSGKKMGDKNVNEVKVKKLPKVDSLYYNLIEQDNKPKNLNKSLFENYDCEKTRKRWETKTAEKNELVSLLNESELIETFSDMTIKPEKQTNIEDLLFMDTTDLSHITVLIPKQIHQPTLYDNLETRRIQLEKELGLRDFLTAYRDLEKIVTELRGDETYSITEPIQKISKALGLNLEILQRVWELVRDDTAFKQ